MTNGPADGKSDVPVFDVGQLHVFTSRYRAVYDLTKQGGERGFEPIVTSLGLPRFMGEARTWRKAMKLAPYGIKGLDGEEFRERYIERLEHHGIQSIFDELNDLYSNPVALDDRESWIPDAEAPARKPLALLCFEDVAESMCHRTLFAEWWAEKTGVELVERNTAADLAALTKGSHDERGSQSHDERGSQ